MRDSDRRAARIHLLDHSADLSVVEPNGFTRSHVVEHARNRDGDARTSCTRGAGEKEHVPRRERDRDCDVARSHFGPLEVHGHDARSAERLRRVAHVANHPLPRRCIVVRAIDAHEIGAVCDQRPDRVGVVRRFRRERHHDAYAAPLGHRSEKRARARGQPLLTLVEVGGAGQLGRRRLATDRPRKDGEHGIDARQHVGLATSERREAGAREPVLEGAAIVRAQREVVNEIARARPRNRRATFDVVRVSRRRRDE